MIDPLLHAIAAAVTTYIALSHPLACAAVTGFYWLLRELAQANSGNVITAFRGLPSWSAHKHLEWIVPLLSALVVALFKMPAATIT